MANTLEKLENMLRHQQPGKCNLEMTDCRMDCILDLTESRLERRDCRMAKLDCRMGMLESRMERLGNNLVMLGSSNLGYLVTCVSSSLVNLGSKKAMLVNNLGMLDCNLEKLVSSLVTSDCTMD